MDAVGLTSAGGAASGPEPRSRAQPEPKLRSTDIVASDDSRTADDGEPEVAGSTSDEGDNGKDTPGRQQRYKSCYMWMTSWPSPTGQGRPLLFTSASWQPHA